MTDPETPAPVAPVPEALPTPSSTFEDRARVEPVARKRDALPLLYLLGFVVLVLAVGYLYLHPPGAAQQEAESAAAAKLDAKLDALSTRIAQIEQRPVVPPVSLAPVEGRIAALEGRLAAIESRPLPTVDLGPVNAKIDAATAKQADALAAAAALSAKLSTVEGRVAGAEQQAKAGAESAAQLGTQLTSQLDAKLASATGALDAKVGQATTQLGAQVDAKVSALTDTAKRLASVQAAGAALEAGQKLGPIPGAPPALARFFDTAPPTDFALRQAFGPAADAALAASQPQAMDEKPFIDRLWTRAQQSVSVREGDRVLLGDPVAGVITRARRAVEGNDLAAALVALQGLSGPPRAALAPWMAQAQALIDARAAIAQLAARG